MSSRGLRRLRAQRLPGRTPANADSYEDRPLFALGARWQASGAQDALPAGLWGPRRPPGKPPGAQDALPAGHLGPRTPLPAGLWGPRHPPDRPLGPKTPSRQAYGVQDALPASPLEPRTLSWQATWVLDALLAGPLERKTPFRPGSLRPRNPFDTPSEVQDPLWAPTTLS